MESLREVHSPSHIVEVICSRQDIIFWGLDEVSMLEETRAVAASKAWLKDHEPIPNEEVLAEFGLTAEDFERMGRTPLEPEPHHPGQ